MAGQKIILSNGVRNKKRIKPQAWSRASEMARNMKSCRHYDGQSVVKCQDVGNDLRVFRIGSVWRIAMKVLNPLCMHRIHLHQLHILRSHKMH
jgi:hypothetical protein